MSSPTRRYRASTNDSAAIARSCTKAKTARRDFGKINTRQRSPAVSEASRFYSKDRQNRKSPHRKDRTRSPHSRLRRRGRGAGHAWIRLSRTPALRYFLGLRYWLVLSTVGRRSLGGRNGRKTAGDRPRRALSRPPDQNACRPHRRAGTTADRGPP